MFINNPQVYGSGKRSSLLAKFDTLGNMLWYKVVKSSESHDCFPYWMEVEDDKVYISGDISLGFVEDPSSVNSVWLYYLDTLITGPQVHSIPADQRRPPYKTGRYTYFATLDLDGNLLDNHFVASFSRKIYAGGVRAEFGLCQPSLGYSPFHVDSDGNTFVYTSFDYTGFESDPYTNTQSIYIGTVLIIFLCKIFLPLMPLRLSSNTTLMERCFGAINYIQRDQTMRELRILQWLRGKVVVIKTTMSI